MKLLEIKELEVSFVTGEGRLKALNNINLDVEEGVSIAIIGESGSGKSVLSSAVLRILEKNAVLSGEVLYKGESVYEMSLKELQEMRGGEICLIPQNATQSWNPLIKIGKQMREFLQKVRCAEEEIDEIIDTSLRNCGFDDPQKIRESYSFNLSGGMAQRAMIAMCTSSKPTLLIADEPTKGLDGASIGKVMEVMTKLGRESSLMVITHDLYVAKCCKKTVVLYGGTIIEYGNSIDILSNPLHPYSKGLKMSHPKNGMIPIPGGDERPPTEGCPFRTRCSFACDDCRFEVPLVKKGERYVRCFHA